MLIEVLAVREWALVAQRKAAPTRIIGLAWSRKHQLDLQIAGIQTIQLNSNFKAQLITMANPRHWLVQSAQLHSRPGASNTGFPFRDALGTGKFVGGILPPLRCSGRI